MRFLGIDAKQVETAFSVLGLGFHTFLLLNEQDFSTHMFHHVSIINAGVMAALIAAHKRFLADYAHVLQSEKVLEKDRAADASAFADAVAGGARR